ncbi:autotransporter-associated N-terminal domain-containing protein [Fusobacterium sp. PH5-44]|uniref:autotransporter-associated N-terminal domain-containing protein n=1 Tax=unclassified Fusobacterium TaxID=2648384 RepID=UPI003D1F43DB
MRKNLKEKAEKALKSYLKKKKIGYTTALLTAFLITGGIGLASSVELGSRAAQTQESLLTNIEIQKSEIMALLEENEARLKELKNDYEVLLRQGDYYSKPVYPSTQVFFTYSYENSSKSKDRTKSEWSETINAIKARYNGVDAEGNPLNAGEAGAPAVGAGGMNTDMIVDLLKNGTMSGNYPFKVQGANGVAVDEEGFSIEFDLGVNITPLEPIIPSVVKDMNITIQEPALNVPNLNVAMPNTPVAPASPSLSVNVAVVAPDPIQSLVVNAPSAPVPTVPSEKVITVIPPTLPNEYEPTMISIPDPPTAPVINVPQLTMTDFQANSIGNGDVVYVDHQNGQNSIIANIAVLDGKFVIKRTAALTSYEYKYEDYSAYTFIGGTSAGLSYGAGVMANPSDVTTYKTFTNGWTAGLGAGTGTGVQLVAIGLIGTYNNGNFLVSRDSENSALNLGEFLHMDNHSANNSFASIRSAMSDAASKVSVASQTRVETIWDDMESVSIATGAASYYTQAYYNVGFAWINQGDITLEGGNMSLTNQYSHGGGTSIAINDGTVLIRPLYIGGTYKDSYNAGFLLSNDCIDVNQQVMYNSGEIHIYTNDSAAYVINTPNQIGHFSTFNVGINALAINRNIVELTGKSNIGVFARASYTGNGSLTMDFKDFGGNRAPITMYGDNNIGLFVAENYSMTSTAIPVAGDFNVDIGDSSGTGNKPISVTAGETEEGTAYSNYFGDNTNTDIIENSVGIISLKSIDLNSTGIIIYDSTKNNIGVLPLKGSTYFEPSGVTLNLGTGSITSNGVSNIAIQLNGGENNIGLVSTNTIISGITYQSGNIITTGSIDMVGGDRNIGVVAKNSYSVTLDSILTSASASDNKAANNAIGVYADGSGSTVNIINGIGKGSSLKLAIDTTSANEHSAMAAYAKDGGIINMNLASKATTANIEVTGAIDGGKYLGLGIMSNGTSALINANNNYIKVVDGAAGVASVNSGKISMVGGTIDYNGRGFAVYTDGSINAAVDISNGEIILRGKSVGYTIDITTPSTPTSQVIISGGKITMMSNDAVAFNLTGIGTKTLTQVVTAVNTATTGAPVVAGVEGAITYDKFRLAATDGGNITIDVPIDKSQDMYGVGGVYNPSYFFFRSFLAQKSILTVDADVTAELTNSVAADFYKGHVSGLEMNSSSTATGVGDSQIILNSGKTITADRTQAGEGAIGIYMNFGTVNGLAGSNIKVETGSNIVNSGGIGIYAVDGSKINSGGKIEVNGPNAVGLLGLAYRMDSTQNPIVQEFGGIIGEGETDLTNSGTIEVKGNEGIGIYALNNSAGTSSPTTMIITNTGNIEVGTNSGATNAIGIYGDGDVKIDFTAGTLTIGDSGIGIYGANGAEIRNLSGNFVLGTNGIGVISDGSAAITATGTATFTGGYISGTNGKIGISYVGPVAGTIETTAQTLVLNIDATNLDHGTALFVRDKSNITVSGNTTVGNEGVGIFLNNGDVTNTGNITLLNTSPKATGMYTNLGTVYNTGTISVNHNSQFGMIGFGSSAIVDNLGGSISLNNTSPGSTGILIKDRATIANEGTINFGTATESFGIVSLNSTVNLTGSGTYTLNNTSKNIYVYGEQGSTINFTGPTTINGVGVAGNDKSVGIYLDGTNGANTLNGIGGGTILRSENGIIGVYSKGTNTLNNGTYEVVGDKTVGVYFENAGTLNGVTIDIDAGVGTGRNAVGVYGIGEEITIGSGGLTLNLGPNTATGMDLSNGSKVTGGIITINNSSTTTNTGLYYTGTAVSNNSDLVLGGANLVGLYADKGINLTNNKSISYTGTGNIVGAYVGGNSVYNSSATSDNITTNNSAGIYVADGIGKNNGTIEVSNSNAAVLVAKGDSGKIGIVENAAGGIINVTSGVGILLGDVTGLAPALGESIGKNKGTIKVALGQTGVALSGHDNSSFDGTDGKIEVTDSTGIYLKNTTAGKVLGTGTLDLKSANSVGVFLDNSALDFLVTLNGTSGTGVYATGTGIISGTIDGSNSTGTVGLYMDSTSTGVMFNNATIKSGQGTMSGSGVGIYLDSIGSYTLNGVSVISDGSNSIGIYVGAGSTVNKQIEVTAENNGVGYFVNSGATLDANGGILNIGNGAIGVYNMGTANIGMTGPITINFTGNGGTALYNAGGTLNMGTQIVLGGSGSGSLAATLNGSLTNGGILNVANGATGLIGMYSGAGSYIVENLSTGTINVTSGGIGMAAIQDTSGAAATGINLINSGQLNVSGSNSVGLYSDVVMISNNTGTITVTNNGIGIYAKDNSNIIAYGNLDVTGGIGIVLDGNATGAGTGTITLNGGSSSEYSIGVYYKNTTSVGTLPSITLNGDYTVAAMIEGSGVTVNYGNPLVVGTGGYHDQIGLKAQGKTGAPITLTAGTIQVSGDKNIGVFGEYANIDLGSNTIDVGVSTGGSTKDNASIGVYVKGGTTKTAGTITVQDNSIGIYGEYITPAGIYKGIETGNITIGDNALGVYGTGTGVGEIITGALTVGDNNSIGIYASDINSTALAMTIGTKGSIGIVSEGIGDVSLNGPVTVSSVSTKGNKEGSIGIYKEGSSGLINTSGIWSIGDEGYGIYAEQSGAGTITINNNADMTLGESGVGIYGNGSINITNRGIITVGKTNINGDESKPEDHQNSVGIYVKGGATAINAGTMNVKEGFSVGIYGTGITTKIENSGTMNIDNGGTGILVKDSAEVINSGTINILSGAKDYSSKDSIGIAAYTKATIVNTSTGVINAGDGIGIYIGTGGIIENKGIINVNNGTGIMGPGTVIASSGQIIVSGVGSQINAGSSTTLERGSVLIDKDGNVYVNDNYVGMGGTLVAKGDVILNGAYVAIDSLNNQIPVVSTEGIISGEVQLLPSFATTGNGYHWYIKDFTDYFTSSGIGGSPVLTSSPLFMVKSVGTDLVIYKRPYSDLTIGEQFNELYSGLENILQNDSGDGKEAGILKDLNAYLDAVYKASGEEAFNKESARTLAETRGDVYATIQSRMQDVQRSFDNAFTDLLDSYNITKDSGKYSVIYSQGSFEDDTLGLDDYDYRVQGLLYMKEHEGRNFGNKWGYTLGFAVSRFDFDDAPTYGDKSKEDMYSLRAGLHGVKNFNEEDSFRLVSRLELGYNRHETKRTLELDKKYKNDASYNSYQVTFDNRLEKTVYRSLSAKIDLFAGVNMEYGYVGGFSEKGDGLYLKVKSNDYFSVQPEIGVSAYKRGYIGKKVSIKLAGELSYAYELGENYNRNKAKVRNGSTGYYDLIQPEKEEGIIKGKVGLTIEKANKMGVTFDVEARKHDRKDKTDVRYGVKFKYVF